jgi:ankyrin repeat protein
MSIYTTLQYELMSLMKEKNCSSTRIVKMMKKSEKFNTSISFNGKDGYNGTPLYWLCKNNQNENVWKLILEYSKDKNDKLDFNFKNKFGDTPLSWLCHSNTNVNVWKMIVQYCEENDCKLDFNVKNQQNKTPNQWLDENNLKNKDIQQLTM